MGMAVYMFQWYAVKQMAICVVTALVVEAAFSKLRNKPIPVGDLSAVVTALILALSLPWSAPWYVGPIGSFVAVGLGKAVFGGLGQNLFNPAMVGRAFVMISFASVMGAPAYVRDGGSFDVITRATPLTAAKEAAGELPGLWPMSIQSA